MDNRLRPLGWAAYGVAFFLVVIPLVDTLVSIWPALVRDVNWRFGALGLVSRAIMTPLLGVLLALATGAVMEHRRTVRSLSGLAFLGAVLSVFLMVVFALDALTTRGQVRPEALAGFQTVTLVALAKYGLGFLVAGALGMGGWVVAGRIGRGATGRRGSAQGRKKGDTADMLVGGAGSKPSG